MELVWYQEEPQNQGAWHQIKHRFLEIIGKTGKLSYAGLPSLAASAKEHFVLHAEKQKKVVDSGLH